MDIKMINFSFSLTNSKHCPNLGDTSLTQGDQQTPKQQLPTNPSVSVATATKSTSTVETTKFTKLNDIGQWSTVTEVSSNLLGDFEENIRLLRAFVVSKSIAEDLVDEGDESTLLLPLLLPFPSDDKLLLLQTYEVIEYCFLIWMMIPNNWQTSEMMLVLVTQKVFHETYEETLEKRSDHHCYLLLEILNDNWWILEMNVDSCALFLGISNVFQVAVISFLSSSESDCIPSNWEAKLCLPDFGDPNCFIIELGDKVKCIEPFELDESKFRSSKGIEFSLMATELLSFLFGDSKLPSLLLGDSKPPSLLFGDCEPLSLLLGDCKPLTLLLGDSKPLSLLLGDCKPLTLLFGDCMYATSLLLGDSKRLFFLGNLRSVSLLTFGIALIKGLISKCTDFLDFRNLDLGFFSLFKSILSSFSFALISTFSYNFETALVKFKNSTSIWFLLRFFSISFLALLMSILSSNDTTDKPRSSTVFSAGAGVFKILSDGITKGFSALLFRSR
ncbi:hypothetical protein Anas_02868 [Armadillidium nasatum]|uniref:Uncharacterized protein n=1 Tax=Armadillidium nasatum TaxID=96803 RepID=A0A5N5SKS2_9CRUS|nr:hypothetical protein Anas_02868 [Armadillidium nasatum]